MKKKKKNTLQLLPLQANQTDSSAKCMHRVKCYTKKAEWLSSDYKIYINHFNINAIQIEQNSNT